MSNEFSFKDSPRQFRKPQFSIKAVSVLLFDFAMLLALVSQLGQFGFAVFVFATGVIAGWWFGKTPWITASLTALAVFLISYLTCWIQFGQPRQLEAVAHRTTDDQLQRVHKSIMKYVEENESLPELLSQLADANFYSSGKPNDGWGHPLFYRKTKTGFRLGSLGRDHSFGGKGLDADIFFGEDNPEQFQCVPLTQFIFFSPGSTGVFVSAVIASLLAGSLWLHPEFNVRLSKRTIIFGVIASTAAAVFVAAWLAAFHIAASQSGH